MLNMYLFSVCLEVTKICHVTSHTKRTLLKGFKTGRTKMFHLRCDRQKLFMTVIFKKNIYIYIFASPAPQRSHPENAPLLLRHKNVER